MLTCRLLADGKLSKKTKVTHDIVLKLFFPLFIIESPSQGLSTFLVQIVHGQSATTTK